MKVTKVGHACLLVEEGADRILIDPGIWNEAPEARGVGLILITHEHADHADPAQIRRVLAENPGARVVTHEAAGAVLAKEGIAFEAIEQGGETSLGALSVKSIGTEHAAIYGASPCRNTGYFIGGKLFVPGDALHDFPEGKVEALALPCGGPWMKFSEAIDYAKKVKPGRAFPVHDAMYVEEFRTGLIPRVIGGNLEAAGIPFSPLSPGDALEF